MRGRRVFPRGTPLRGPATAQASQASDAPAFTWTTALQLLGAAAGVAALITFVGGAMLWIRFDSLDLPADRMVAMLPDSLLVVTGAHSMIPALLVALVVMLFAVGVDPLDERGDIRRLRFGALFLVLIALAAVTLVTRAWDMDTVYAAAAGIAALGALGAIFATAWQGTKVRYIVWTIFGATAFFVAAVAILRTIDDPRMEPVAVLLKDAPPPTTAVAQAATPAEQAVPTASQENAGETADEPRAVAGFYVGETDDRLFVVPLLGNGDPSHPFADADPDQMVSLARDEVDRIAIREPVGISGADPGRDQAHTLLFDLLQGSAATTTPTKPVATTTPVLTFAPLVHLHADEKWFPMSAIGFIDNSELRWANGSGCADTAIAVGKSLASDGQQQIDPVKLGDTATAYRQSPRGARCRGRSSDSYPATARTRPNHDRAEGEPPKKQGFYLDLDDDRRAGHRELERAGALTFVRGVPLYYDDRPLTIVQRPGRDGSEVPRADLPVGGKQRKGTPARRITYWMFYGLSEPPGPRGITELFLTHEGDWERISVLLEELAPNRYKPISVRYFFHNEQRDVPWFAVKRAATRTTYLSDLEPRPLEDLTHPLVYSARGSHASYWRAGSIDSEVPGENGRRHFAVQDAAMACPKCEQWETWEGPMRNVRDEEWYGFGGAWGDVSGSGGMTGPLGPSRYKE